MDIDELRKAFEASVSGVTWRTPVIGGYKEGYKCRRSHEPRTFGEPVLVDDEDRLGIASETDRHRLAKVVRHHRRRAAEFDYISWHTGMAELAEKRILEIMLVEGTDG